MVDAQVNNYGVVQLCPVEAKAKHVKRCVAVCMRKARANSISNVRLDILLVEALEVAVTYRKLLLD
jgi:hypothetical protein